VGDHAATIRLLAYTGLRWGAVTALTVHDIDRQARRIQVMRNAVLMDGKVIVGTPKSHKQRSVAYPELLDCSLEFASRSKLDNG